jgi:hypothetical protein
MEYLLECWNFDALLKDPEDVPEPFHLQLHSASINVAYSLRPVRPSTGCQLPAWLSARVTRNEKRRQPTTEACSVAFSWKVSDSSRSSTFFGIFEQAGFSVFQIFKMLTPFFKAIIFLAGCQNDRR